MSESNTARMPLRKPGGRGLTEAGARKVLALRSTGATYSFIVSELNISVGTVHNVCEGASWAWLRDLVEHGE